MRQKLLSFVLCALIIGLFLTINASAAQTDIVGPAGSGTFGDFVTVLPNGNIVVVDFGYDLSGPTVLNVGAVHLYNGTTLALISTLTGSTANDQVGFGGITVLTNGNYVVSSKDWSNPSPLIPSVGAATWCSATTGCSGVVSASNSLIGSTAFDIVGRIVTALPNGNYVVNSFNWDNPSPVITDVGAITWGNGTTGTFGVVSASNSLIGGMAFDIVGFSGVTALTNGNYVVNSPDWNNPSPLITQVGAVTWGNGAGGTVGLVSAANSLIGGTAGDAVGNNGVTALTNGNYVVSSSSFWNNPSPLATNAGAVTWGNGAGGTVGVVSAANSLIGGTTSDQVGSRVEALTNGNYVVSSPLWNNPSPLITEVGAVTWGNGAGGTVGLVSAANSLIGGTAGDAVGNNGVTALTNGNYVVSTGAWDDPSALTTNAGAATWGNGATGTVGLVSAANSLIGGTANNRVGGQGVKALTNGNYVVSSANWDNPSPVITNVGAVTWGNGTTGTVGVVSAANSLIGGTAGDLIGFVTVLTNGNYVVSSSFWDNPSPLTTNAGAVTWGNGAGGTVGLVSATNSLIGSTAGDEVSRNGVKALTNGNYVVQSPVWDKPSSLITDVGAATWGSGLGGTVGVVSASNSLIGGTAGDAVGSQGVTALTNGNYVVRSGNWNNPSPLITEVGAVTWGNGAGGTIGSVSASNSLIGGAANDSIGFDGVTALTNGNYVVSSMSWDNPSPVIADASAYAFGSSAVGTSGLITNGASGGNSVVGTVANGTNTFAFDATRNRIVVGRRNSNIVSVLSFTTKAIADGDLNDPMNWDNGVPNGLVTGIITVGSTMTISSIMNIGQLQVQCGGNLTGGSASAYIVGSVRRDFCAAVGESFNFPIGDPNNYSPLNVANVNGTGNLTASVTDTFMPGLPATTKTLSRYWSLEGAGITANLTFNYVNADVNGTESVYRVFRRPLNNNALITQHTPSSVDTANNTITAINVSQFSDWGVAEQLLAPTAANAGISGRVTTASGNGISSVVIQLTDAVTGEIRFARTSSFGYYSFEELPVGQTYILNVTVKRFTFANPSRVISLNEELTNVDFVSDKR